MTEREIQDFLHRYYAHRKCEIPNVYLYDWESDFISVTKTGFVHEYEIKVSLADFKNDTKKKIAKHEILLNGARKLKEWERVCLLNENVYSERIRETLTTDNRVKCIRPNYFWYICPEDLISVKKVPEYAGLIHSSNCYLSVIKLAPRLHTDKITQEMQVKLMTSFYFRYWKLRNNKNVLLRRTNK